MKWTQAIAFSVISLSAGVTSHLFTFITCLRPCVTIPKSRTKPNPKLFAMPKHGKVLKSRSFKYETSPKLPKILTKWNPKLFPITNLFLTNPTPFPIPDFYVTGPSPPLPFLLVSCIGLYEQHIFWKLIASTNHWPADQWTNWPMDQWTNGPRDQLSNGPMDQRFNGPMDVWTHEQMDQWTNWPMD